MKYLLGFIFFVVIGIPLPASAANVIFYVPFDDNADPVVAQPGAAVPQADGDILLRLLPVRLEKGVVGSAAYVKFPRFSYPAGANFRSEAGTISLWVKPNWPGTDTTHYHVLFSADGWGMIYKYTDQTYLTFGVRDKNGAYSYGATADIKSWRPGEWHHVAGTWSAQEHFRRLYLDGKKVGEFGLESVVSEPPKYLTVGATGRQFALDGLVDEVYVFDAPLTDAEISLAFDRARQGRECWKVTKRAVAQEPPPSFPRVPGPKPPAFVDWSVTGAYQRENNMRGELCLNGFWRWQPATEGQAKGPGPAWFYRKVPGCDPDFFVYDEKENRVVNIEGRRPSDFRLSWAQREFQFSEQWRGRRVVLTVQGARGVSYVYLDGVLLGSQIAMEPVDFDVTKVTRPGLVHTLTVLSEGIVDDVWLRSYPEAIWADDVMINTSTRKKNIRFSMKVENRTPDEVEVRGLAIVSKYADGSEVLKRCRGETLVKLDANSSRQLELTDTWADLELWTPETPNLYWLVIQLHDPKNRMIDRTLPVRFGFREFWIEKGDLILNGHPVRLRGHSNVPLHSLSGNGCEAFIRAFFSAMKALNLNSFYTMWAYYYSLKDVGVSLDKVLDVADEMGIMAMPDVTNPIHFGDAWEEAFVREHYKARIANMVKRYRYHPSVIMWMADGGLAHTYDFCPAKMDGSFRPEREIVEIRKNGAIADEGRTMIQGADYTRPSFYHSSGNFGPVWTTMAYLGFDEELQEREDWPMAWARRRHKPVMVTEFGLPVVCSWHKQKSPLRGLDGVYQSDSMFVEYAAMYFGDEAYRWEPMECVAYYGPPPDLGILRSKSPAMWRTKALFAGDGLRAWRTYGISFQLHAEMAACFETKKIPCITYQDPRRPGSTTDKEELSVEDASKMTELGEAVREACRPLVAYIGGPGREFTSKDHAFYAGEWVKKQAAIINDTSEPTEAEIRWAVENAQGEPLFAGQMHAQVQPGEIAVGKYPLEFTAPETTERTAITLKIDVDFSNGQSCSDEFVTQIFPRAKPQAGAGPPQFIVFDPQGETEKLLRLGGYPLEQAKNRKEGLRKARLLIVGRSALQAQESVAALNALGFDEAVRNGLNVLVFEQATTRLMGLRLRETSPRHVFMRASDHPALAGLRAEDFVHWRGESNLVAGCPDPGPLPAGVNEYPEHFWRWGNRGCVATYTIEKPQRGAFRPLLDCGFDLFETPLIEFLVGQGRIIFCQLDVTNRYGTDPVTRRLVDNLIAYLLHAPAPKTRCAFAGSAEEKSLLEGQGLSLCDFKTADAQKDCPLVFVGNLSEETGPEVKRFVKNGGWAVCLASASSRMLPKGSRVERLKIFKAIPPARGCFAGISPADLFLRGFYEAMVFENTPGGGEATEPAVLVSIPEGNGRFIYCGIALNKVRPVWQATKLRRALNILAANAGAGSGVGPGVNLKDEGELYPKPCPDFDPYKYWRW